MIAAARGSGNNGIMAAVSSGAQANKRHSELEDPLNRWIYHPLAGRLARLLRPTVVTPNAVSFLGMVTIVAAAGAYSWLAWPVGGLVGLLLHMSWHVLDGADGDLARMTGKASANGELVDGVCDYAGHVVLYIALAAILDDRIGIWAWVLSTAAGASHIVQNNHYEAMRRSYLWWAYGVPWLRTPEFDGQAALRKPGWFNFVFGWMATDYLSIAQALGPRAGLVDRIFDAHAQDRELVAAFRLHIRERGTSLLPYRAFLGANFRTVLLGVSMIAGGPWLFFLGEVVALNLLLVASARRKARIDRALAAELEAIAARR